MRVWTKVWIAVAAVCIAATVCEIPNAVRGTLLFIVTDSSMPALFCFACQVGEESLRR